MTSTIKAIPNIVIGRLPLYLRALAYMIEENREFVSSQELGDRLGISSVQIRKDLSHFGEFGKQGTGYEIQFLRQQLRQILHADKVWEIALVGAGDLGHALIRYEGFCDKGFCIAIVFDHNPQKIGRKMGGFEVFDAESIPTIVKERGIKVAIIAVPASEAQAISDILVKAGVRAILNYAPITLSVPPKVQVQYINPIIQLQHMAYYLD